MKNRGDHAPVLSKSTVLIQPLLTAPTKGPYYQTLSTNPTEPGGFYNQPPLIVPKKLWQTPLNFDDPKKRCVPGGFRIRPSARTREIKAVYHSRLACPLFCRHHLPGSPSKASAPIPEAKTPINIFGRQGTIEHQISCRPLKKRHLCRSAEAV